MKLNFFLAFILFFMFACIFPLQKQNLYYSEPCFLIGFRMFFSGSILLFYFKLKNNILLININKNHIKEFLFLALFNIYLTNFFELLGLNGMASSKACLIYSLSPFLTSIFAYILLKEKLNKIKFIGLFIGFSGLFPLLFFKTLQENYSKNLFIFSYFELFLIMSVIFSVFGWIYLKKLLKLGYSLIFSNSLSMILGGLLILLSSFLIGEIWNPIPVSNFKIFFIYTILTSLISNFICYNLFGYLLKYFSVTFMTFFGLITPFFAIFFGYIFLNEPITWYFFLSIFLFFIGLVIFYKEEFNSK